MKKSGIKPISGKRRKQMRIESELTQKLWIKQKGLCGDCSAILGWRSAKHELIFRSKGGNPTDEDNCVLLCGRCHSKRHGIKEGRNG